MDEKMKYAFLTPFGLVPTDKDYKKDLVNIDRFLSHFTANENFICSMFDYDGLPDSIDERFIEEYLTSNGSIAFVNAVRFEKGEGIEKKEENFAAEIASMM